MGGGGGGSEGEPEFQIAPIIDVLLVLLVFFMSITTAQVEAVDKNITLPVAPDANARRPNPNEAIINIRWIKEEQKGVAIFDKKEYTDSEELKTALEVKKAEKAAKGAVLELLIRGDKDLQAKEVQKVMQAAAAAGIDSIGFSTYNQGE